VTDFKSPEKKQLLIDVFESYAKVLEEPPDDVRFVVMWWEEKNNETEMEFHSERPKTVGVGGHAGNCPDRYQVWELVEDYDRLPVVIEDDLVMRICETIMTQACGEREAAYTLNLILEMIEDTEDDWDVVVVGLNSDDDDIVGNEIDPTMIDLVALIHDNETALSWLRRQFHVELLDRKETK
jgi:hypothetical protein